jgi:integrase
MRGSVVKRGRTWSYVVDVGGDPATGRRRQRWKGGFATKREAELALRRALDRVDVGEVAGVGRLTVAAYLEQSLAGVQNTVKPTTAKSYAEVLRWYVIPRVGALQLANVTPLHIRSLYADLLEYGGRSGCGLSAGTVAVVHRVLRKACNDAVAWRLITRSPLTGVQPPRRAAEERRTWTAADVRRFLGHAGDDRLYAMWALLLATGLRRGEIAGLRWDDVDLGAAVMSVRRSRVSVAWAVHDSQPKTRSSRRSVSLDVHVVAILRAHRRQQLEERLAWGSAWIYSGFVFVRENGEPIHPEAITSTFATLVGRAGARRSACTTCATPRRALRSQLACIRRS